MTGTFVLDGQGPLYEQIRRALAKPILEGRWPPGVKLPSEHELTGLTGASRMTVNKALHRMAEDGLIVRRRKAGTFVARPTDEHAVMRIADLADEIRAAGHVYGYRLLTERQTRMPARLREALDLERPEAALVLTSLHLADGEPAVHEERWISLVTVPEARGADFAREPAGRFLLAHVAWTRARHTISAVEAGKSLASQLRIPTGAACLVVERTTWRERRPVTFVRLTYPGHRHRLVGWFRPGESLNAGG
ncbi:MAG: UTRA domain-containing protein [Hyphomicrobiaceae bacterium]